MSAHKLTRDVGFLGMALTLWSLDVSCDAWIQLRPANTVDIYLACPMGL